MDVCLDWNVSIIRRLFVITWNLLCYFMYLYQYALFLCVFFVGRVEFYLSFAILKIRLSEVAIFLCVRYYTEKTENI